MSGHPWEPSTHRPRGRVNHEKRFGTAYYTIYQEENCRRLFASFSWVIASEVVSQVKNISKFDQKYKNTNNIKKLSSSVHSLSSVRLFATPWTTAHQASLTITNSQSLLKLMSIESVMSSNHLILCCPLLLLPSIFPSIRVFSNESVLRIRWPKYWSFSFSISSSNEYSGLISFRKDWLDLLAVQGTLKSLLQHHTSKASILQCSAFFIVQLSHPYMTTRKTIALPRWTFVGRVMSLLFFFFFHLSLLVGG